MTTPNTEKPSPPPPYPHTSYCPSSILRDPTIADHLNGTTILKSFPKVNQNGTPSKTKTVYYEGHVTGYRTTNEGDILHKIHYPEDDDEEEFTFNELQTYHHQYLNKNKISSHLSITIPPPSNPPPPPTKLLNQHQSPTSPFPPAASHTHFVLPSTMNTFQPRSFPVKSTATIASHGLSLTTPQPTQQSKKPSLMTKSST